MVDVKVNKKSLVRWFSYIIKGYNKTIKSINQHKILFFFLICLQILFFFLIIYSSIVYVPEIVEHARGIIEPLESGGLGNIDPTELEMGNSTASADTVMEGVYSFYRSNRDEIKQNYESMVGKIINYLLILMNAFIFLGGLIRILVKRMLVKQMKIFRSWLKYFITWFMVVVPALLLGYLFVKSMFSISMVEKISNLFSNLGWSFILSIYLILYILFITTTVFVNTKSWKEYIKLVWQIGVKKINKTSLVFLINMTMLGIGLYLVYLGRLSENLFLMIFVALVIIFLFVLTKIFWTACIEELVHEKTKKHINLKKMIKNTIGKIKKQ